MRAAWSGLVGRGANAMRGDGSDWPVMDCAFGWKRRARKNGLEAATRKIVEKGCGRGMLHDRAHEFSSDDV